MFFVYIYKYKLTYVYAKYDNLVFISPTFLLSLKSLVIALAVSQR